MKYSIPVTLVLFCALSTTARAQEATADVLADVTQDLVLTSSGQTRFGNIGNFPHTETIDPKAPTATQSTAQFILSTGASVLITCPSEVTLTEPVSSAVMIFTPALSASDFVPDQSGSFPIQCPAPGYGAFQTWLWLGGNVEVASNQVPGSYSGVFTLTAAYQ